MFRVHLVRTYIYICTAKYSSQIPITMHSLSSCQLSSAFQCWFHSQAGLPLLIRHQQQLLYVPISKETSVWKGLLVTSVWRKLQNWVSLDGPGYMPISDPVKAMLRSCLPRPGSHTHSQSSEREKSLSPERINLEEKRKEGTVTSPKPFYIRAFLAPYIGINCWVTKFAKTRYLKTSINIYYLSRSL